MYQSESTVAYYKNVSNVSYVRGGKIVMSKIEAYKFSGDSYWLRRYISLQYDDGHDGL